MLAVLCGLCDLCDTARYFALIGALSTVCDQKWGFRPSLFKNAGCNDFDIIFAPFLTRNFSACATPRAACDVLYVVLMHVDRLLLGCSQSDVMPDSRL